MKNTFIVFVAALLAVAFGSEAQSEDIRGLKLNHSKMGWLANEPDPAGNVLQIANCDEFAATELMFGALGTNCKRVPVTGKISLATLADGRIGAAVFTGTDSRTLLNSIRSDGGQAFSIQAAGSL